MRHTRIVATVGPASATRDVLAQMLAAGVDVFRLNFSHGTHASHAATLRLIREVSSAARRHVAVMQDLSGPKIRTGPLADGPLALREGDELRIGAGEGPSAPGRIFTAYAELIAAARPGDRLLLDDGRIELRVVGREAGELAAVVVNGGTLGAHKGINAPGIPLPASALTGKDARDLRFGLEIGVDFVALSFVQTAEDVLRAREVMADAGRVVPVIAKIERPAAVQNLREILDVSLGVMVARGDLGLEMPLEQVPRVQKAIIRQARMRGRPVIVATQVLESMRVDPRPTRAEVSDAAHAVDEGVDGIMLAGETAIGAHPVRAVETLAAVIADAETVPAERIDLAAAPSGSLHGRALCEAAVTLAKTGQANAIVAVTRHGNTARLLSALRPPCAILAATDLPEVAAALTMYRGVTPIVTAERDVERLERVVVASGCALTGQVVVFVNIGPDLTRSDANFLNVQKLG
jgi:pyruvate kinase